jgi:hypothetical protein
MTGHVDLPRPLAAARDLRVNLSGDGHLRVPAAGDCSPATWPRDHHGVDMDVRAAAAAAAVERDGRCPA